MKHIILFSLVLLLASCKNNSSKSTAEVKSDKTGIQWLSMEKAQEMNKKAPKDIFVMVHANWCPKCARFKSETYANPKVIDEINSMFYPVMLNAHDPNEITFKGKPYGNPNFDASVGVDGQNSYHELLYEIGAQSIPSIVFMNSDLEVVGSEMGFKEADELRSLMRLYAK